MSYTLAYTGAEIDALLGKIDAIFVAEYGSTIYSEVTAAIAAGNKVIVANAGKVFVYAGTDDNSGYVFTQSGPNAAKPNATYVTLSTGNVWSTATVDLATLQQFYDSFMTDTASGSIASFPDGAENVPVTELTADIEPIQDLHGYSNPWPADGGKNKANIASATKTYGVTITANVLTGTVDISGTPEQSGWAQGVAWERVLPAGEYIVSGVNSSGFNVLYDWDNKGSLASPQTVTVDGTKALKIAKQVTAGTAFASHVEQFMIRLSTEADATFAPYSNICPITGYTGAEINVTGINVWDEEWEVGGIDPTTGQNVSANNAIRSTNYIACTPNTVFFFKSSSTAGAANFFFYGADKSFLGGTSVTRNTTVITPLNARFMRFKEGASYGTTYNHDISVNYPSTDTSYHAYNGTTYSISWQTEAGTVYKGNDNVTEGELTVINGANVFNNITGWYKISDTKYGTEALKDTMKHNNSTVYSWSDTFPSATSNTESGFATCIYTYNNIFIVKIPTGVADVAAFLAAYGNSKVMYELASPQTYHLASIVELKTLLGDNNIFADCGDVEVEYRCNTALYIKKKLGE